MHRLLGVAVLFSFIAAAFLPWDAWYQSHVSLSDVLLPPSFAHPLGTDNMGRDLLVRVATAIRTSVLPLWLAASLASASGLALGVMFLVFRMLSGIPRHLVRVVFYGFASLPISLVVFAIAVLSEQNSLIMIAAALFGLFCVRSFIQVNDLYEQDALLGYWQAHEAIGGSLWDRLVKYGLSKSWRMAILESYLFNLQIAVSVEVALSYLGFGVSEPNASFGNMLASHLDLYLKGQWWTLLIIVVVLAGSAYLPKFVYLSLASRRYPNKEL